jgi:molecular chaperone GrpE
MTNTPSDKPNTAAGETNENMQTMNNSQDGNGTKLVDTVAEPTLEQQLAEAKAKSAEYLEGWQRARAEFTNYKKRADKEREDIFQNAAVDTLNRLLPVIDDFDLAIANVPADKANDEVIKGFNLIHRKLIGLLDSAGIKLINPVGEMFNPAYHEAIGHDANSTVPSGHVSTVLRKGFIYGERVLRPALVRVAS